MPESIPQQARCDGVSDDASMTQAEVEEYLDNAAVEYGDEWKILCQQRVNETTASGEHLTLGQLEEIVWSVYCEQHAGAIAAANRRQLTPLVSRVRLK